MPFDNTLKTLSEYGSVFRFGSGLLGKSIIVIGPLITGILVIGWSLHSDGAKFAAMALAVGTFFIWYFPFLRFCDKHPAEAMLDGAHWAQHQRQVMLAAKGQPAIPAGDFKDFEYGLSATQSAPNGEEQKS